MPTSEVEFIRQGTGSIQKYLEENVEAYGKNKSKVDEFLDTEIEFIGED